MADQQGFTVTLKDIYAELVKVREQVGSLEAPVKQIADHEVRLRALERWRYALPTATVFGAAGVIAAVLERR